MSAFIVSKSHIDCLITAGLLFPKRTGERTLQWSTRRGAWKTLTLDNASEVGAMLWEENRRSVNTLYQGRHGSGDPLPAYVYEPTEKPDPVVLLKSLQCYEYQSCEHEKRSRGKDGKFRAAWERSEARAFCEQLRAYAINNLPGYDDAPWGIEDRREVA